MTDLSVKMAFILAFGLLICLSIDVWNWRSAEPLIAGMPYWVLWSMLIVIVIGIYYALFSKYVWRDE